MQVYRIPMGFTGQVGEEHRVRGHRPKTRARQACRYLGSMNGQMFPPPEGVGNLVSASLRSIGVTKERFSKLISLGKSEAGCGCNRRIKMLNWVGKQLGLPAGMSGELQDALLIEEIAPQPIHHCNYDGMLCLPRLRVQRDGELEKAILESGYRPCRNCQHYTIEDQYHG